MPNSRLPILVDAILPSEHALRIQGLSARIELVERTSGAIEKSEILYTSEADFTSKDLPHLKWIQLDSVGISHLKDRPLLKTTKHVTNVRGAYTPAVAECAIGLLLTLTRRLHICHFMQLKHDWPEWPHGYVPLKGENCYGKTMAIIGYGSIGRHVARIAHAMGMKVVVCKRCPDERSDFDTFCFPNTGDPEGTVPLQWFGPDNLINALRAGDAVVVTLPSTESTRGVISKMELDAMRPGSYLVNVGRGSVIDETALLNALKSGPLAGAAFDVFSEEPIPVDSPLWQQSNLFISPHIGSTTSDAPQLAAEVLIENLKRYLDHRPLLNRANVDAGY